MTFQIWAQMTKMTFHQNEKEKTDCLMGLFSTSRRFAPTQKKIPMAIWIFGILCPKVSVPSVGKSKILVFLENSLKGFCFGNWPREPPMASLSRSVRKPSPVFHVLYQSLRPQKPYPLFEWKVKWVKVILFWSFDFPET